MSHTIIKGAEWVLRAERGEGAPEAFYAVECMTCRATSGRVENDLKRAGMWALGHAMRLGLAHSQFGVITEKHWRADRHHDGPVNAGRRVEARRARPPRPRAHARRQRPVHPRRVIGFARRLLTDPLTLLCLALLAAYAGFLFAAVHLTGVA